MPTDTPPFFLTLEKQGDMDIKADLRCGDRSLTIWLWLVTDALGDLVRATTALLSHPTVSTSFIWQQDDCAYELSLRRDGDLVHLHIHGPGATARWEPSQEVVVFEAAIPVHRFASQVKGAVGRLHNLRETASPFHRRPFPSYAFDDLITQFEVYTKEHLASQ